MISVIIPAYNCERTLERAVESVLSQSFEDWELLIIDHCSTDRTRSIAKQYEAKDPRISVFSEEGKGGAGVPRNRGIREAAGDWIFFLDGDDYLSPDALEKMESAAVKYDADVTAGGYRTFVDGSSGPEESVLFSDAWIGYLPDREKVREFFTAHYPEMLAGVPWNKLYRRTLILDRQIAFPQLKRLEDGIFNIRFFSEAETAVVIKDVVCFHMESEQVELGKIRPGFFREMKLFTEAYDRMLRDWGCIREECEEKIAQYFLNDLVSFLEYITLNRKRRQALRLYRKTAKDKITRRFLQEEHSVSLYTGLAVRSLREEKYARLWLLIKGKYAVKHRFRRAFFWLRNGVSRRLA